MKVSNLERAPFQPIGFGGIEKTVLWRDGLDVAFEVFRLPKGSRYPRHGHASWEAMYILEGAIDMDGATYRAGDFLFTTPGEEHEVRMLEDTLALFGFGQAPHKG
jgi:quercetin dioxygenase-like cupin family protein